MSNLSSVIKPLLRSITAFTKHASGLKLRAYQVEVAQAICDSVIHQRGLTFVVMFPRQSGKNELQAQIETYLLMLFSQLNAEIVKVSPTWRPQTINAMRRLERVLKRNLLTRNAWKKKAGYIYEIGSANIYFFSGGRNANIVGATASTLLEVDEAQDVSIPKFDKDIAPMAASTNATRVFWGTAWTSRTLLARELAAAQVTEQRDGIKRVFILTADQVAAEVPVYGAFVAEQIAKLGRHNPMVLTQYFSQTIDAEAGMFPPARAALLHGAHLSLTGPTPGQLYALLIDVAGEDESELAELGELTNPRRDTTTCTVVEVDLSTLSDPLIAKPSYRIVARYGWTGIKHTSLYGKLRALAEYWSASYVIPDATGVGAGLSSFLDSTLNNVIPFVFNANTKSKLGWDYITLIESGRLKDHANPTPEQLIFNRELDFCQLEIIPGPEHRMKWSVPDGTRDPATGELVHDDWIISAALASVLDEQVWEVSAPTAILQRRDPLAEMDEEGF